MSGQGIVNPFIRVLRLLVRSKGKATDDGIIVRIALPIRLFVTLIVGGLLLLPAIIQEPLEPQPVKPGLIIFVAAFYAVLAFGLYAAWRAQIKWREDALHIRPLLRKSRWYTWQDIKVCWGTHKSWVLEMSDGAKFRGNDWTSGGIEFLEAICNKRGFYISDR